MRKRRPPGAGDDCKSNIREDDPPGTQLPSLTEGHKCRGAWYGDDRSGEGVTMKSYGKVSEEQQKAISGLEFVQGLVDGSLPLNTMAQTLGYDVTEVDSGRVVITAVPNDTHLNPAGGVHGGLSATLLDSCMGLAVLSKLEKGIGQTTLEFKISLVRPITPETGMIKAEGIVLTCG